MTPGRRLAAVAVAGILPWVVVVSGPSVGLVASFGLVVPATWHVTPVWTYVFVLTGGLPESLLGWPVATLLYALAFGNAAAGRLIGYEDRRLTGGLLILAGGSLLPLALAVGRPAGVLAVPVGTVALWAVAWWGYRGGVLRAVSRAGAGGGR